MSEPTKLHAVETGTALTNDEIAEWLELWAHHIRHNSRPLRSLVLIVESSDGDLGVINTGKPLDKARLLGLSHMASDRILVGENDEKAGFLVEDIPR